MLPHITQCVILFITFLCDISVLLPSRDGGRGLTYAQLVPHRTSNDVYMDPCKAAGFMGDIALSEEEFKRERKYLQQMNNTMFELQVEDPRTTYIGRKPSKYSGQPENTLKKLPMSELDVKKKKYLRKILKEKKQNLKSLCKKGFQTVVYTRQVPVGFKFISPFLYLLDLNIL
ncbi:hypothetical protein LOTGIDRAFT_168377 [Lottia gigantea]|uniref:Uncharacterized protein n=1 Tax=Lottia gigantea TaxID=225164 RepID=V3Z2R7_LOTGI|nr:hypothetical protein LOTGIDRAFT_168377 [Lottia gigantea]ESO84883.1 hypothetical protein LOTGIDRAFT_168377 [Lottia gigantea]